MARAGSSKYAPLTRHLLAQSGDVVEMKFSDIERVIGAKLPASAHENRSYWSNNAANSVLTRAWLAAGFRSQQVNLADRKVAFRRAEPNGAAGLAGFSEERAVPYQTPNPSLAPASLFGCMAGTIVVNCDLTEPADPDLAAYLDEAYGPAA